MPNNTTINNNIHRQLPSLPNLDRSNGRSSDTCDNHCAEIGNFAPHEINQAHNNIESVILSLENAQINNTNENPQTCAGNLPMIEKVVHALSAAMPIVITASSIFGGVAGAISAATENGNTDNLLNKTFTKALDGSVFGALAGCTLTVLPFATTVMAHRIRLATDAGYAEQFRRTEPADSVFANFLQAKPAKQAQTTLMSEMIDEENIELDASLASVSPTSMQSALNSLLQDQDSAQAKASD